MEFVAGILKISPFRAITWAIAVLFVGRLLIRHSRLLRDYNIPEPVVGGLLFALLSTLVYFAFDIIVKLDLGAQFVIVASLTLFVVFRLMGRNYDAAVVCSGFGGITLGSTATGMANMTAVTNRYGPSHLAFIIVPLVCAFFIAIVNAFMIQYFLAYL